MTHSTMFQSFLKQIGAVCVDSIKVDTLIIRPKMRITCRLTRSGPHISRTKSSSPQRSTSNIQTPMSCLPQRCARQLLREPFQRGSIPLFLTPAFSPSRAQCFSTTSPAQSRVGGAAISIPPEVSLSLVDLPKSMSRTRGKDIPTMAAHIKGPKGM